MSYATKALLILAAIGLLARILRPVLPRRVPKGLKRIPGPRGWPVIGSLLDIPPTRVYFKFREWSDEYGPIMKFNVLGWTHIVIADQRIANDLLSLRGAYYSDRPPLVMQHELIGREGNMGSGAASKYWKNGRKLVAAIMSNATALDAFREEQLEQAARLAMDLAADPDNYIYLFERYSTIITLRMLYDKEISQGEEEVETVSTIMDIAHSLERSVVPGAFLVDLIPVLKYLPHFLAPFKREADELHEYEYSFFRGLLKDIRQNYDPTSEKKPRRKSVAHLYLENPDQWKLSDFQFAYGLGTIFMGGSITNTSAMQSYVLGMLHYPEWQEKIHKELDDVVGTDRTPRFEDLPNLPILRAAMKEALRWIPVIPQGIPRYTIQDDTYDGFFIPKGCVLHATQFAMFKDEDLYPDADTFNPGRWLEPKYQETYQAPLTEYPNMKRYAAFGFGRRICPGIDAGERSLFAQCSTLSWAYSAVKKLDEEGNPIPIPWYPVKPKDTYELGGFEFELESRDPKRLEILRQKLP